MHNHSLIHLKGSSTSFDISETCRHGPGHHNAGHLDIAGNDNFLHVMAEVGNRGQSLSPNRFLSFPAFGRQSSRRVDHHAGVEEFVECVEISCIPGREPSVHDRSATILHAATQIA
jgi:hypothetical protein